MPIDHIMMQGKGGSSKSLSLALLTQRLLEQGIVVRAYDTDPVNHTLTAYKAFKVKIIDIMNGSTVDPRRFDVLMEDLLTLGDDEHAVIDNGASTFLPLGDYMANVQTMEMLKEAGHTVYLHTVVTGGQALHETIKGLRTLIESFPDIPVVVWLNRYFGEIVTEDGRSFEQMKIVAEHGSRMHAQIAIPFRNPQLFGKDLESLFSRHMTFAEANKDEALGIMVRQRLKMWWTDMAREIDKARLF